MDAGARVWGFTAFGLDWPANRLVSAPKCRASRPRPAGFVYQASQFPKEAYGRLPARSSAVYCSANDACRQSLSPEEARKLDARLAKVRDAYFRRLPESDPEYDEMQDLLKKAQDLAANATYAPGACTEDNNRRNAKRSRDA